MLHPGLCNLKITVTSDKAFSALDAISRELWCSDFCTAICRDFFQSSFHGVKNRMSYDMKSRDSVDTNEA